MLLHFTIYVRGTLPYELFLLRSVQSPVLRPYFEQRKGKVVHLHAVKAFGAVEIQLHSFLTTALNIIICHIHTSAALPPCKKTPEPTE